MSAIASSVSPAPSRDEVVFTWTINHIINNILPQPEDRLIFSSNFTIHDRSDQRRLAMKNRRKRHISVALCDSNGNLEVDVPLDLAAVDGDGHIKLRRAGRSLETSFGWPSFVSLDQLRDPRNGLLVDGKHLKLQLIRVNRQTQARESLALRKWNYDVNNLPPSDVRLLVGAYTFEAHRQILAGQSDFFAAMFANNFIEQQQGEVRLEKVEPDVFKEVLRFIYNGQVDGLDDNIEQLVKAADFLQMADLKCVCVDNMIERLSADNCLHFLRISDETNATVLKTAVIEFINEIEFSLDDDAFECFFSRHSKLALQLYSHCRACLFNQRREYEIREAKIKTEMLASQANPPQLIDLEDESGED